MKKFLFVAAAVVASMVFTGCINEDDTYKKLQPVQQGINIYNWTYIFIIFHYFHHPFIKLQHVA